MPAHRSGHGGRVRAWARAATAAVFGVLWVVGSARAGEVPSSALSRSLALEPMFIDYSSLLYRFPQLIASRDSVELAFGRVVEKTALLGYSGESATAIGATLRNAHGGGFFLSQTAPAFTSRYDTNFENLLQVGVGGGWRGVRVGVAVRGQRGSSEDGAQRVDPYNELDLRQKSAERLETVFGIGLSGHGAMLDAVVEWTEESLKRAGLVLSTSDTLGARLSSDSQNDVTVALRLAVPVGERLRMLAIGQYRTGDRAWSGDVLTSDRVRFLERQQSVERWSAGLSALAAVPHMRCVAVSGYYAQVNDPNEGFDTFYGVITEGYRLDSATIAVSCQGVLWRRLVGSAGLQATYSKEHHEYLSEFGRVRRDEEQRQEWTSHSFEMGVAYDWRNFEFAAALSPTLDLTNLFRVLDVHIKL